MCVCVCVHACVFTCVFRIYIPGMGDRESIPSLPFDISSSFICKDVPHSLPICIMLNAPMPYLVT